MSQRLRYVDAGVDRGKAALLMAGLQRLRLGHDARALRQRLRPTVGGYAAVWAPEHGPWLAATTDGVGTKLKLAFESGQHDMIGQDLVAMSVNDLLCVGAQPIMFLDYFATARLDVAVAQAVLRGVARACAAADCLLVGGETAEMPGMYHDGEYDLAGFAVGTLAPSELLPRRPLQPGDQLIGLASSGFHANGFSLLRRILDVPDTFRGRRPTWARERASCVRALLQPTVLYPRAVVPVLPQVLAAAHVTGAGLASALRMGGHVSYTLELPPLGERARVFRWLRDLDVVAFDEAARTFNLGLGMVLAVAPDDVELVLQHMRQRGQRAWRVGEVVRRRRGEPAHVFVRGGEDEATLTA